MRRSLSLLAIIASSALAAVGPAAVASADGPDASPTPTPVITRPVLPAPSLMPDPSVPETTAAWVNETLRIVTSYAGPIYQGSSDGFTEVRVDGKAIETIAGPETHDRLITVPRTAAEGPALVEVVVIDQEERGSYYDYYPTTVFSATVRRLAVTATAGQVSAESLLGKLRIAKETRAGTYRPSKWGRWIDADHDGQNTRAEALKAESSRRVTTAKNGTVLTGQWTSPYAPSTVTRAADLRIDHRVQLHEAWTSGAATWSKKRRIAFANDLGYAPSLFAIPKYADLSRSVTSRAACTSARDYIAVKYRWGLAVDPDEKTALRSDLARHCVNPYVTMPGKPDISALAGR